MPACLRSSRKAGVESGCEHRRDAQEAGMNKFSGIDLHSNNSVVVVSDDADRVLYQRRLPNDPVQIRAALAPHREDLVGVVIEATYNWYWLACPIVLNCS